MAHRLGLHHKEVAAIVPLGLLADELQVRLMYQPSGLQGLARLMTADMALGHPAQLVVNEGRQPP
jgi:hypothetical protein